MGIPAPRWHFRTVTYINNVTCIVTIFRHLFSATTFVFALLRLCTYCIFDSVAYLHVLYNNKLLSLLKSLSAIQCIWKWVSIHSENLLSENLTSPTINLVNPCFLREFSIVVYDLVLDSNVFTCSLEALKRREGRALRLFRYNDISLETGVLYNHGQFSIIIYDLMLDSNVFTCSLEAPKRQEGRALWLFRYNDISLETGVLYNHSQFSIIIYDLMLDSNIFTCSLEAPKRREGRALRLFCYNDILLETGVLYNHELSPSVFHHYLWFYACF
jgi:hypothetical protein